MKSLSPIFLTRNAATLQWSFALVALDILVGGFFANQGYWELSNSTAERICNVCGIFLSAFVVYRLAKPQGLQHIQSMMLLLLLPKTELSVWFLIQQTLVALVVVQRGLSHRQMSSFLIIAAITLPLPLLVALATQYSPVATTKGGKLISTIDKLYSLYAFEFVPEPCNYKLFRVIPVVPGFNLVKKIAEMPSTTPVQVKCSKTGAYSIEKINKTSEIERAKPKVLEQP
ncbi:hypothetical protein BH11CYA1_BH11CYA1_20070 [soil metagenome]